MQIPDRYLGIHIQQRRKRGRSSLKSSELGDAGEARCRARLELQAQYKVPQVKKFGFVKPTHVDMVDDGRSRLMYFNLNHLHLAQRRPSRRSGVRRQSAYVCVWRNVGRVWRNVNIDVRRRNDFGYHCTEAYCTKAI